MHLYPTRVSVQRHLDTRGEGGNTPALRGKATARLRAAAAVMLTLATSMPSGWAQQQQPTNATPDKAAGASTTPNKEASNLPPAPTPVITEPLYLRPSSRDFTKPAGDIFRQPWREYLPTSISKSSFENSVRLRDLVKDGKIYLSLSDAIALALENNYDIAISRYYLDIADLDILRSKAGSGLRGVGASVLQNTIGGTSQTLSSSGAPGGATGATTGTLGIVLSSDGAGPLPENEDPVLGGTVQFERQESPQVSIFQPRAFTNTNTYNFTYSQGFVPGTSLQLAFNNSRQTTFGGFNSYSPDLSSTFKATVTQHLLQGAGVWVNKRFMYEAVLDRRITDSTFRQQILATVNQVENIYWVVVSAYEDVQAKERALQQSTQVLGDTKKQLDIGTMAPLDVVQANSTVATDKQNLISSQSNLNYQQLILKQAIARNLNDPELVNAAVIPTDRISLDQLPEEKESPEELVREAFVNRPELEQAVLSLKKDEITLRGARNGLLPVFDAYGFYGAQGLGGAPNKNCFIFGFNCAAPSTTDYGDVLNGLVNSSSPDKGIGFTLNIPLRNRTAQADHARALVEYRQAELHLEQLYTQIHMQVVNKIYGLTNDRAQVQAATAARDYAQQSLEAEQKKLGLGASTSTNVLQKERDLATAENTLINATATYATDRAALYQILAKTLSQYGISLVDAATGEIKNSPVVPGLVPSKSTQPAPTAPPPATQQ
ncbi:TolC family protein [Acidobacteria bacterium AB60]|nr:TolC family protein [Acidobacteria bacterium AB60]